MTPLLNAIHETGDRFEVASQALGKAVSIDPATLLHRDAALGLTPPGLWSPNRHCQMVEALDGWIAVSLARKDDVRTVPAWTGCALDDDPWDSVLHYLARTPCAKTLETAQLLHLPIAQVNETRLSSPVLLKPARRADKKLKAIDLSALWAGPLCGGLLASAGVDVTRIESTTRPDPTPMAAPSLHQRLNGQKQSLTLTLDDARLIKAIAAADILITSGRPHALARHGLSEDALFACNPALIWVAITAHGWRGEAAMRTGFGDDCAAAGGLVAWRDGAPHFMGDALADPLTGLEAALAVAQAVDAGKAGLIDVALAQTAALYASRIGLR
jgi:hypothetical protein